MSTNLPNEVPYSRKLVKYQYLTFGFLLFDLVYIACLFGFTFGQSEDVWSRFGSLGLLYVLVTVAAVLGVRDRRVGLFYPVLVFTLSLMIASVVTLFAVAAQFFVCRLQLVNATLPYPLVDCARLRGEPLVRNTFFLFSGLAVFLFVDKLLEFFAVRRLMALISAEAAERAETLRRRLTTAAVCRCKNHGLATVNANGSEPDTEDDLVVYRSRQSEPPVPALDPVPKRKHTPPTVTPSSPPPAYKSEKSEPPDGVEELPLRKKSTRTLE